MEKRVVYLFLSQMIVTMTEQIYKKISPLPFSGDRIRFPRSCRLWKELNHSRGHAGGGKKSPMQRQLLIAGRHRAPPRPPPHQFADVLPLQFQSPCFQEHFEPV
uniref:Uncharacterized protein n=1 Tax=Zea mays TaxID=4577 RepID=C0HH69_MAIZE|nr:unknown [Zea mays]